MSPSMNNLPMPAMLEVPPLGGVLTEVTTQVTGASRAIPSGLAVIDASDEMGLKGLQYIKPEEGMVDVVVHGTPNQFALKHNGEAIYFDGDVLGQTIKESGQWNGEPIRLISCKTGACSNGAAQKLADVLNVVVKAPTDDIWPRTFNVGPAPDVNSGSWVWFRPGGH